MSLGAHRNYETLEPRGLYGPLGVLGPREHGGPDHKDKSRVHMPAKMFPHLKLLCWPYMGPTLGFDTKQRKSFLIKFVVFYNKSKILTILLIVKYEVITLFDEFLVLLGAHNQQVFARSNEEKNRQKQKRVLDQVLSLWSRRR